ncbi:carbonic anhydrase family protein [Comamonas sp. JC664]|uniref:carbonic anhydrase n=1 Tax=Comamonas sp. JC664 TaxID=2801917 RepID=UPI00174D20FA|nr:carbonic anhydrase family protein [Comamonas sp. JC664]MBL0693930.1 carbonic anhydrase family protein [Comamonas sp. JC664]GHH03772.1 carbonic anhydrase [Comamonas sp. KCTC 72670]
MSFFRTVSVRALQGALVSSVCLASSAFAQDLRGTPAPVFLTSEDAHWGYSQTVSPERWGELPGNSICAAGLDQSPIALVTSTAERGHHDAPHFNYRTSRVRMTNNGHTVQFTYDAGSTVQVDGNTYHLAQFHFHTPSEHTKDGVEYPLEVHLVHTDANGTPALVVGVLIKEGFVHPALFTAFRNLPKYAGEHSQPTGAVINASSLLPLNRAFFKYAGSLTTPPCTEGLQWYVMKNPIEMSDAQIASFQRLPYLNPNNRPLQPLNGRVVSTKHGF